MAEAAARPAAAPAGPPLIEVRGLRLAPASPPVDLDVRAGEIVGLAGLDGHGQEAFLEALCGLHRPAGGTVAVRDAGGRAVPVAGFAQAVRQGVAYLPRDRRTTGVFPALSVLDNFAIAALPLFSRLGFVGRARQRRGLDSFTRELSIVYSDPAAPIGSLSGGNQQKVLLARWLARRPRAMLLNDPTRGVDLATRMRLYDVFRRIARQDGIPLVVLSTEIEEILQLCDRVLVFREQRLFAELDRAALSMDRVIAAMFGQEA